MFFRSKNFRSSIGYLTVLVWAVLILSNVDGHLVQAQSENDQPSFETENSTDKPDQSSEMSDQTNQTEDEADPIEPGSDDALSSDQVDEDDRSDRVEEVQPEPVSQPVEVVGDEQESLVEDGTSTTTVDGAEEDEDPEVLIVNGSISSSDPALRDFLTWPVMGLVVSVLLMIAGLVVIIYSVKGYDRA